MLNDYIKIGQRIELQAVKRVKMQDDSQSEKVYSSKIYVIQKRKIVLRTISSTFILLLITILVSV